MLTELLHPNTCMLDDSKKKLFREKIYHSTFGRKNHDSFLLRKCLIDSQIEAYYDSLKCSGNK
ncbi:hypothetical protein HZS_3371 [Henneguya salminicola]|nr:hypothetical protein HZS_3371 [Henneguya salminicola]